MASRRRQNLLALIVVSSAMALWGACSLGDHGFAEHDSAPRKAEKSLPKDNADASIADTKKKGFDGVDFSYDAFGALSGQDPVKISEQVKAKDIADKPKVLAKQKQLLDTVEFFNVVGGKQLTEKEKKSLVAFLRAL